MTGGHSQPHGYWTVAAEKILTGLVFGLLFAVVFVSLSALPAIHAPLHAVEQIGIETGMLIYSRLFEERQESRVSGAKEPGYTFIDIDPAACTKFFSKDASVCQGVNPARPELTVALTHAVARAGPRVIVIDADPFAPGNTAQSPPDRGEPAAAPASLPPVLYPAAYRPSSGALVGTLRPQPRGDDIFAPLPNLRAAAVTTRRLDDPDSKVRRYAPVVTVKAADGAVQVLPTLPLAAAAIATANSPEAALAELRCAFSQSPEAACAPAAARDALARKFSIPRSVLEQGNAADPDYDPRFFFSVRSLALERSPDRPGGFGAAGDLYLHIYASTLLQSDGRIAAFEGGLVRDRVVVIGSSAESGLDWHATPLGYMSGAEIILNAIRGFVSFAPLAEHSFVHKLIHKIVITFVAGIAFAPAWLLIVLVYRRTRANRLIAAIGNSLVVVLFLAGVLFSIVAVSMFAVHELRESVDAGYGVDVITPVLAVALEGFAEGSSTVLQAISAWVERFLAAAGALILPLRQRFQAWRAKSSIVQAEAPAAVPHGESKEVN